MSHDSARTYEREAENARLQLASTLEELRVRLNPSHMVDEVKTYARTHMMEPAKDRLRSYVTSPNLPLMAGALYALRSRPMPALLIGTGAYMLWRQYQNNQQDGGSQRRGAYDGGERFRSRGDRFEERRYAHPAYRQAAGPQYRDLEDGDHETGEGGLSQRVGETTDEMRRRMHDMRDQAGEVASSVYERASDYASSMSHTAQEAAETARQTMRQAQRRVRSTMDQVVEEQPLALVAMGLLAGAAIGAMLPRTRIEDEYVGETARDARRQAKRMAREQYQRARHVVSTLTDDIQEEAHKQGLDAEGLSETASDIGRKVKTAAANVGRHARDKFVNENRDLQQAADSSGPQGQMGGSPAERGASGMGSTGSMGSSGMGSSGPSGMGSGGSAGGPASGSGTTNNPRPGGLTRG